MKSESSNSKRRRRSKRDDDDIVVNDTSSLVDDSELFVVDTAPTGVDDKIDTESSKEQLAEDADEGCGSNDNNDGDDEKDETTKRKRKRNRKNKSSGDDGVVNTSSADAASAKKQQLLSSVEHTVFIEGLPFTSTSDQVRHFFEVHGCTNIIDLRLPTWQDSGRLRGFGHVVFASEETRARALSDEVNGKELGGRYVTVREANAPRAGTTMGASTLGGGATRDQPKGCKTIFVKNLPYDANEDDILESFRVFGKIIEGGVRVARNHVTATSKGFGYVEFKNEEGALAAVQKAAKPFGLLVKQRPVFVDYDEGTVKGSFRDSDGKLWNKDHSKGGSGTASSGGRGGRGGGRGGFSNGRGGFGGRGSGASFGGSRGGGPR